MYESRGRVHINPYTLKCRGMSDIYSVAFIAILAGLSGWLS